MIELQHFYPIKTERFIKFIAMVMKLFCKTMLNAKQMQKRSKIITESFC